MDAVRGAARAQTEKVMGSKAPPPGKPLHADLQEDDAIGLPLAEDYVKRRTPLQRIADALQISPTVMYQPQNAVETGKPKGQTVDYRGQEGECAALIHAFLRIADPEERRRILALVQASAERA